MKAHRNEKGHNGDNGDIRERPRRHWISEAEKAGMAREGLIAARMNAAAMSRKG